MRKRELNRRSEDTRKIAFEKFRNAPLMFTAELYIYQYQPAMITFATDSLATEVWNKLTPSITGLFTIIAISPTTFTNDEDGIRNIVSIDQAILVPSAKFAASQFIYTPYQPVDNRDESVDEGRGQTVLKERVEAPPE